MLFTFTTIRFLTKVATALLLRPLILVREGVINKRWIPFLIETAFSLYIEYFLLFRLIFFKVQFNFYYKQRQSASVECAWVHVNCLTFLLLLQNVPSLNVISSFSSFFCYWQIVQSMILTADSFFCWTFEQKGDKRLVQVQLRFS